MSIFKDTIKDDVYNQIKAREKGEFKVIEDNSEWDEKADATDLFEPEEM